jgi:hypothetical protein
MQVEERAAGRGRERLCLRREQRLDNSAELREIERFFDEFDRLEEVFPAASYQYVLYGMGFESESSPEDIIDTGLQASRARQETERQTVELLSRLPTNRDLLNKIREYGLQPV